MSSMFWRYCHLHIMLKTSLELAAVKALSNFIVSSYGLATFSFKS